MPDRRRHRGPHPEDALLFRQPESVQKLRVAAGDLAWLLGRHYTSEAALTLVGNRYQLRQRQRQALSRAVAAPAIARARRQHQVFPAALAGEQLQIDALNQIITIEAALAGSLLLRGHDGALRDLASIHGTYRAMQETYTTLAAIGNWLTLHGVQEAVFLIDALVSNSGRLASQMRAAAATHGWSWSVQLVPSADPLLQRTADIVATSDSAILDKVERWFDLAAAIIQHLVPTAWYIDLDVPPPVVA
jgi:hypothetical protein